MKTEFVTVQTPDFLELPALLFTPEESTDKAAVFLHGMGSSAVFYDHEHIIALATSLTARGIGFLALNNRGAHLSQRIHVNDPNSVEEYTRYQGGCYYEKIADCVADISGAVQLLQGKDFAKLALIGESTGANKICVYNQLSGGDQFDAYVLAGGGDDSGIFYSELGEQTFYDAINRAKTLVDQQKPLRIMPKNSGMNPFSAQSTYDILHPNEPYNVFPFYEATTKRLGTKQLFEAYKTITNPTLVIYGEHDEFAFTAGGSEQVIEILRAEVNPAIASITTKIINNATHSFDGNDYEYAEFVAEWLSETL